MKEGNELRDVEGMNSFSSFVVFIKYSNTQKHIKIHFWLFVSVLIIEISSDDS